VRHQCAGLRSRCSTPLPGALPGSRPTSGRGVLAGEVTPIVIAEFAHQRFRQTRDRREASLRARQAAGAFRVQAVDSDDLDLALDLYARSTALDAFDALLAATALNRGLDAIVSADRAFEAVDGIKRIDPADAVPALT